jgi:hypothetical protein
LSPPNFRSGRSPRGRSPSREAARYRDDRPAAGRPAAYRAAFAARLARRVRLLVAELAVGKTRGRRASLAIAARGIRALLAIAAGRLKFGRSPRGCTDASPTAGAIIAVEAGAASPIATRRSPSGAAAAFALAGVGLARPE